MGNHVQIVEVVGVKHCMDIVYCILVGDTKTTVMRKLLNHDLPKKLLFLLDTLHLYIKIFHTKNSTGQILTLISNSFLCFN